LCGPHRFDLLYSSLMYSSLSWLAQPPIFQPPLAVPALPLFALLWGNKDSLKRCAWVYRALSLQEQVSCLHPAIAKGATSSPTRKTLLVVFSSHEPTFRSPFRVCIPVSVPMPDPRIFPSDLCASNASRGFSVRGIRGAGQLLQMCRLLRKCE
jgi:hypothetical protein